MGKFDFSLVDKQIEEEKKNTYPYSDLSDEELTKLAVEAIKNYEKSTDNYLSDIRNEEFRKESDKSREIVLNVYWEFRRRMED